MKTQKEQAMKDLDLIRYFHNPRLASVAVVNGALEKWEKDMENLFINFSFEKKEKETILDSVKCFLKYAIKDMEEIIEEVEKRKEEFRADEQRKEEEELGIEHEEEAK